MKFATILLAASVAVASEPVTIAIKRHDGVNKSYSNAIQVLYARHGKNGRRSVSLTNQGDYLYTAPVTFGNGQAFTTDLDTGSSDVWTRGASCTSTDGSCGTTGQASFVTTDTTCTNTGKTFTTSYGSGSVTGKIYSGPVSLGGITTTINFGVSTTETGFNSPGDGLWGLGYSALNSITGGNFIYTAGISNFAFYFSNNADADNGELTINGVDTTKYTGSFQYVPLSATTYYQFATSGSFAYNGVTYPFVGSSGSIADTGTTLLITPTAIGKSINAAIGATAPTTSGYPYDIACTVAQTGKPITVTIGTAVITLNPSVYVLNNGDGTCSSGILGQSGLGVDFIFGDIFLRAAYTVFDVANSRVGFAQAVHPGSTATTTSTKTSTTSTTTTKTTSTTTTKTTSTTTTTTTTTTKTTSSTTTTTTKPTSTTTTSTTTTKPTTTSSTTTSTTTTKTTSTTASSACAHGVCATGVALTSSCSSCASLVCAYDSYCCSTAWDSYCVAEVYGQCGSGYGC